MITKLKYPDLRRFHEEVAAVIGGVLYRRGRVVQVWWNGDQRETWNAPDVQQAKRNYEAMKERFNEE